MADHRMPDTARPVVRDEGSPFPVRLGNDAETVQSVDAEHFLEHDPDRPVRDYARGPRPVHVRLPGGGYKVGEVPEPLRGMPGDSRPEITEHADSHVSLAQLAARGLHDLPVPIEYHDHDPAPSEGSSILEPGWLIANDRRQSAHRQKDAHRRAGDLRQREGAIPGPWTDGETTGLPMQKVYGEKAVEVRHSSQFPSLHLTSQAENPNPAQEQAMKDIQTEVETQDRLRHFKNELDTPRRR